MIRRMLESETMAEPRVISGLCGFDLADKQYIWVNGRAINEPDPLKWGAWMNRNQNQFRLDTQVAPDVRVKTSFLGLDYGFDGDPLELFETMIFGGPRDDEWWRYATWAQAQEGHEAVVAQFCQKCPYCGILRKSQQDVRCPHCGGGYD